MLFGGLAQGETEQWTFGWKFTLPALLSAEVCGCEGSKKWLPQNNSACVQHAGAADDVYLLFISS